ncbi:LLM class flavin-dependent oxidoreductase [Paraflavitalea speifideaquila]|uniref:LLM class flavin-dependent oxidoreductase n=1 Tax=Paraflavitalea speifideaquila TaxID=3076558 RepID=UPI0028F01148|nr:LLM class flavin-dependent oxidoreductase [Paraflavitalea speifideiaquila]
MRFRTAGVSLPLHHPAEVVEWWAMNDILSGGRIDLGFGTGWNKPDFIFAPDNYEDRKQVCWDRIPIVQKLWRGETVLFPGPGGELVPVTVYPRPVQKS